MVIRLTDNSYDLDVGRARAFDRAQTIRALDALIWITEEGSIEDTLLAPGECFETSGRGRVVIAPLAGKARFTVSFAPSRIVRAGTAWRAIWQQFTPRRGERITSRQGAVDQNVRPAP